MDHRNSFPCKPDHTGLVTFVITVPNRPLLSYRLREVARVGVDDERFETIYRANVRAVLSYAASRTNAEEAKDIVAETFLVAWRRLEQVPDDPTPWLIGVARRTIADRRRSLRRRDALTARLRCALTARTIAVAAEAPIRVELRGTIATAFRNLSRGDQDILALIVWAGFTPAQLAVALGCSKPAASVRLHRARRRLLISLRKPAKATDRSTGIRAAHCHQPRRRNEHDRRNRTPTGSSSC